MKNNKNIIIGLLVALLVLFVFSGFSGMMPGFYGYGSAGLMMLTIFLLPVALVLLIVWLVKQLAQDSRRR